MKDIVITGCARTAVGKFGGSLKDVKAAALGSHVIKHVLERTGIEPTAVDEVVLGCVGQVAEDAYIARVAALNAGLPEASTALTVNRVCSSGLQAMVIGAMELCLDEADIIVAGGTENMNQFPFYLRRARSGYGLGHGQLEDGIVTALTDPFSGVHMGITAENLAEKYGISREVQDQFAAESQRRAAAAQEEGKFDDEIAPLSVPISRRESITFARDEHLRPGTTVESLAKLRPAFKKDGTVTAGNASGINDGAAAVVMMTADRAAALGQKPLVRLAAQAVAGVSPDIMGIGPVPAVGKLLQKTGLSREDVGLWELNEAFAAQSIACIQELDLDPEKVNVNGGAIALGHPIGATGAILTVRLIGEMIRRQERYGVVSLCIGGGQGLAVLFELVN